MATVRIATPSPGPAISATASSSPMASLVVLADDAGLRALPVGLRGHPGVRSLSELPGPADSELMTGGVPEQLAAQLLHAAGPLWPGWTSTSPRRTLVSLTRTPARRWSSWAVRRDRADTRPVRPRTGVAAEAGAPVRVADPVLDRWSVPVPGDESRDPSLARRAHR